MRMHQLVAENISLEKKYSLKIMTTMELFERMPTVTSSQNMRIYNY